MSRWLWWRIFLGFISAVAFATILAVVSGLTLAGASAIGRDLYVYVINSGKANEKRDPCIKSFISIYWSNRDCTWNNFSGQNVAF